MINNSVSIDEFRSNLAELIGKVMYGQDRIMIKKYNRDAAVLLSVDEYKKLIDPTKRFAKKEWIKKFTVIDKIRDQIPVTDQESLKEDIVRAVREVRAEKKKRHGQEI